jgi:hypothetical protein
LETETEKSRLFFCFCENEAISCAALYYSEQSEESAFFFKETKAAPLFSNRRKERILRFAQNDKAQ